MTTNWQPPTIPAPPAPEPPSRSWFARHKILTAILALVAVIVLAQAVSGGDDPAPAAVTKPAASASPDAQSALPEQPAETDEPAEPKEPDQTAKLGTAVRDGQFEFTVTKVQAGVAKIGSDMFGEKAQGQFVLVHVTVENIGDEAQYFSDSDQKVQDAKGREFSADTGAALYVEDNDVFLNEINPGNTVKGVLVYDMPKNTRPASIELHDSAFSGGVTVRLG